MKKWVIAIGFLGALSTFSPAHEWYDYDCCDTRDCYQLDENAEFSELPNGDYKVRWVSPLSKKTIEGIVPKRAVRDSQNAFVHGCEIPGTTTPRCIYILKGA